jgi:hypothetical protein
MHRIEEVKLYICRKIPLVTYNITVVIDLPDILEIVDVMDAGFRKVVGVNDTAQST